MRGATGTGSTRAPLHKMKCHTNHCSYEALVNVMALHIAHQHGIQENILLRELYSQSSYSFDLDSSRNTRPTAAGLSEAAVAWRATKRVMSNAKDGTLQSIVKEHISISTVSSFQLRNGMCAGVVAALRASHGASRGTLYEYTHASMRYWSSFVALRSLLRLLACICG